MQHGPRGRIEAGIGALLPADQVGQHAGGHHGGGHTPLVEAGGHIEPLCAAGIGADIGQAVQSDAVLSGPSGVDFGIGIAAAGKLFQRSPAAALPAGAVPAPAHQQQVLGAAEGHAVLSLVHIHP